MDPENIHGEDFCEPVTEPSPNNTANSPVDVQDPEESQLGFQDNNSTALHLLLRIAHSQFVNIPSTLP